MKKIDYVNNEEPFGLVRPDLRQIIFHCFADDDEESYEISYEFDHEIMCVSGSNGYHKEYDIQYIGRLKPYMYEKYEEDFNPFSTGLLVMPCNGYEIVVDAYYSREFWVQNYEDLMFSGFFVPEDIDKIEDEEVKTNLYDLYNFVMPIMIKAKMIRN